MQTGEGFTSSTPAKRKRPAYSHPASFESSDDYDHSMSISENPMGSAAISVDKSSLETVLTDYEAPPSVKRPPPGASSFSRSRSRSIRAPFSNETPYLNKETPIILATARHCESGISAKCNTESILQLHNYLSNQTSGKSSSEYFGKRQRPGRHSGSSSVTPGPGRSSVTPMIGNFATSRVGYSETPRGGRLPHPTTSERTEEMSREDLEPVRAFGRAENSALSTDNQLYMGVLWHGGKLGVAYYDLDSTMIHMMLDTPETDDFKLFDRILNQVNPSQIILSTKQDERLLKKLKAYAAQITLDDSSGNNNMLQFLPSIDFSSEICKRRVLSIDLPCVPDHFTDAERTLYLSSLIPFDNPCMIRAMGGLLKYLEKMRIGIELEEAGTRLPVLDVATFTLETQMIMDDTAYSALQIFQRESHPSVYKSGTSNSGKEGLSLFGIMNRTKSQIGSKMLRTWFQRPLRDLEQIRARHEALAYFNNPRHMELVQTLEESVKHVKNVSRILSRMKQSEASVGDWQALYKTVYNATCIKEVCKVQPQTIYIFKKISEKFSDELYRISNYINKIVDFQMAALQDRFVVKSGVDAELDKKRRLYSGLPDLMTRVAHEELKKLGDKIAECSVLYKPQIGHLLAIHQTDIHPELGDGEELEIDDLQFVFVSDNVRHYRSSGTLELDFKFGDIRCDITDIETNIMHRLQNIILQHSDSLVAILDITADLDCLLTLAACAREFSYVKPNMVEGNVIEIVAGRHPIQELCCSTFVPNDIFSSEQHGMIKVLTGPNACGKSVYLKQVALIVFLAQIGSFVPAQEATIGLVDRIYTRVRSLESVSVGLSTFMIDINQMAEALRSADEKSLCIVDEFGKGTEMIDGVSLLCSSLTYWIQLQNHCPHVFVSTHFHSIIHQHLLPKSPQIKYMTLETLHNGEDLVFLYQLVEGHTSSSYACHVAAQAGLPKNIIQRGIQASKLIRESKPIQRVDTVDYETSLQRCTSIIDKFLELNLETADIRTFLTDVVLPTMEGKM